MHPPLHHHYTHPPPLSSITIWHSLMSYDASFSMMRTWCFFSEVTCKYTLPSVTNFCANVFSHLLPLGHPWPTRNLSYILCSHASCLYDKLGNCWHLPSVICPSCSSYSIQSCRSSHAVSLLVVYQSPDVWTISCVVWNDNVHLYFVNLSTIFSTLDVNKCLSI